MAVGGVAEDAVVVLVIVVADVGALVESSIVSPSAMVASSKAELGIGSK